MNRNWAPSHARMILDWLAALEDARDQARREWAAALAKGADL